MGYVHWGFVGGFIEGVVVKYSTCKSNHFISGTDCLNVFRGGMDTIMTGQETL